MCDAGDGPKGGQIANQNRGGFRKRKRRSKVAGTLSQRVGEEH